MGKDVRETIREMRIRNDLTQEWVAEKAGISCRQLIKIENGQTKSTDKTLEKILNVLKEYSGRKRDLECIFDYVRVRFPTHDHERIITKVLHLKMKYMLEIDYGLYGYIGGFQLDNIRCYYSKEKDSRGTLIELSGKGCRQFECYLEARRKTWFDFLKECQEYGGNFTRIDLAINDYRPWLSIPHLMKKIEREECISRFRSYTYNGSGDLAIGENQGVTIYFGSKQSELNICFYQKDYEQSKKLNIPVEEVEIKNRYELRLKKERADQVVQEIFNAGDIGYVAMGILNNYIRFVDRDDNNKNRSYWGTDKNWKQFIGESDKIKLATKANDVFYEKTMEWLSHSVAPSMKVAKVVDSIKGTKTFEEIIEEARLDEKHLHMIDVATADIEDMVVN